MANGPVAGVWGGTTEVERAAARRQDVDMLAAAGRPLADHSAPACRRFARRRLARRPCTPSHAASFARRPRRTPAWRLPAFWLALHRARRRRFTRSSSSGAGNSVHPGTSARVRSRKLRTAPAGTLSRTTVSPAARSSRCNRSRAGSGHNRTAASPAGSSRPRLSRSRRITQRPQGSVGCGGSALTSRSIDSGSAARHRSATSTRHGADAGPSARTCAPTSADAPVVGGPSSPPGTPPHASHCAEATLRRVGRPPTGPVAALVAACPRVRGWRAALSVREPGRTIAGSAPARPAKRRQRSARGPPRPDWPATGRRIRPRRTAPSRSPRAA